MPYTKIVDDLNIYMTRFRLFYDFENQFQAIGIESLPKLL
jgi:hypothetical protein